MKPDFNALAQSIRSFTETPRKLAGPLPTIAITPVADGRTGAYESNAEKTWRMVERVYNLITDKVKLPDGVSVKVVVAPEIVYGARTGA
ncbi:MAG: hypothetical protein HOC71_00140, partial [Candidatus Latescibacteria bacterium]|nr:hypothetical protein [Candidatus Latescibacterota bacterium]